MSLLKKDLFSIFSKLINKMPLDYFAEKLSKEISHKHRYNIINGILLHLIHDYSNYQIVETKYLNNYPASVCGLCVNNLVIGLMREATIEADNVFFYLAYCNEKCLSNILDFCKDKIFKIGREEFDKKFLTILPFFKSNFLLQEILNVISVMYFMFI
jgi:hypothetical protein